MKYYLFTLILFFSLTTNSLANGVNKQRAGSVERIILLDNKLIIDTKMDTGATIASLSAVNIKTYRLHNKLWVQFEVDIPSSKQKFMLNKPVLRYMSILKRKEEIPTADAEVTLTKHSLRPVIELPICLGNQIKKISVNLVDRSNFRYPMLLGKNALRQFHLVVDVDEKYLIPPQCFKKRFFYASHSS